MKRQSTKMKKVSAWPFVKVGWTARSSILLRSMMAVIFGRRSRKASRRYNSINQSHVVQCVWRVLEAWCHLCRLVSDSLPSICQGQHGSRVGRVWENQGRRTRKVISVIFPLANFFIHWTLRSIGVSNFSIKDLEELLKTAKVVPAVNQVSLTRIRGCVHDDPINQVPFGT